LRVTLHNNQDHPDIFKSITSLSLTCATLNQFKEAKKYLTLAEEMSTRLKLAEDDILNQYFLKCSGALESYFDAEVALT
jgi:hypothetical protein